MIIRTLVILVLLHQVVEPAMIFISGIPVDPLTMLRTQLALNLWQMDLVNNYGKPTENLINIKRNTDRVTKHLQNLTNQIAEQNNIIIGDSNSVLGSKNLIIGSKNSVLGNRNYVFTQGFRTLPKGANKNASEQKLNDTLVSDKWVGELGRKEQIFTKLSDVIYPIS